MTRISVFLISISIFFASCSKDDPSPDLTVDFIGTWKSEIEEDLQDDGRFWRIWNITKVSDSELKVTMSYSNQRISTGFVKVDVVTYDKVTVINNRTIDFLKVHDEGDEEVTTQGNALITGNNMFFTVKTINKSKTDGHLFIWANAFTMTKQL